MKRRLSLSKYLPRDSVIRRMASDEYVEQVRAQAKATYRKPSVSEPDPTLESAQHDQSPSKRGASPVELASGEPAASPWVKSPEGDVRASALPSSLRPRDVPGEDVVPDSETLAGVPVGGHRKAAVAAGIATFVLAVGIGLYASRTPPPNTTHVPARAATVGVIAATSVASAAPSVEPTATAAPSTSATAEPTATPSAATPATTRPAGTTPRVHRLPDEPHATAIPSSAPTVQPQAASATANPTTAPVAPPPPNAPTKDPTEDPVEGPRIFGK